MPNLSAGIENRNIRYFTAYGHCNAYGHTAVNRSITATLADDNKLAMLLDRGHTWPDYTGPNNLYLGTTVIYDINHSCLCNCYLQDTESI